MRILLIILFVFGLIVFLHQQFPYVLEQSQEYSLTHIAMLSVVAIVAIATGLSLRKEELARTVLHGGIWLIILAVLVVGFSYRDTIGPRVMAELLPGHLQTQPGGEMTVQRSQDGHFHIIAQVNGAVVDFMVDTGASAIVLSPDDARRAGINVDSLRYDLRFQTANGIGGGARVVLRRLSVGTIELENMPAVVNQAPMDGSLLGMRFLEELTAYHVSGNTLTLVP